MRNLKHIWLIGLGATLVILAVPLAAFAPPRTEAPDDPWSGLSARSNPTDHTYLLTGPFATGEDVTRACLDCHPDSADQVMATSHWTWTSQVVEVPWRDGPVSTGKLNLLNNFCIGVQSNWEGCTKCHAGYGWQDAGFDFENESAVDCLVCHEQTGAYVKSTAGLPAEGVDLLAAAQSVGRPTRANCGTCHFYGGGGDAVKHGDLDSSLTYPPHDLDAHMGRQAFECVDCHRTMDHQILGRSISVSVDDAGQVACSDCHSLEPHPDDRLNAHTDAVACQTCHIPAVAVRQPTKVEWDWSTAGHDWPEDPHEYLKIKGSFVYAANYIPQYSWYNGVVADRYLLGDEIDPAAVTALNPPAGDIDDPSARIWPFKVHLGIQPYDAVHRYLLQPKTAGEGGFWEAFDWDQAFVLGSQATGFPYSGQYGWARTTMYWPLTHMVAPAGRALQCGECHSPRGRLDWEQLGYPGDPMVWGGRLVGED